MKLAIQRLVRGDDGVTKVIFIDLDTLLEVTDITGYRVVSQGQLTPEPVASVDTPDVPSTIQPPIAPDMSNGGGSDPMQGVQDTPYSQSPAQKTIQGAKSAQLVSPEDTGTTEDVPDDVSPPSSVEPEETGVEPSLGHLGGIRTNQGSILPDLQQARFEPVMGDATKATKPGSINVSPVERSLANRNELENIKDASLGTGRPATSAMADLRKDDLSTAPTGFAAGTGSTRRPESVTRSINPAGTNVASAPREAVNTAIAGVRAPSAADTVRGSPFVEASMNALEKQAADITGVFDSRVNKTDVASGIQAVSPAERMSMIDGTQSWSAVGARPGFTGKGLPAAKPTSYANTLDKTKDDFAGTQGTTQTFSVFDTPNKSIAQRVKDDAVSTAKTPSGATAKTDRLGSTRTTGFSAAMNNPNQSKTTSFVDEAGYSKTDRTGNRGWRNNNPGNIEASAWTKSQPGYIGTDNRFAIFDTVENGVKAQAALLGTKNYASKTIAGAISMYAPEFENNTRSYTQQVANAIGVDPNTKMSDLSPRQREQMVNAMHEVEGSNRVGSSRVSLTQKGIDARDNYTGLGLGADTPSERNAASRPSSGGIAGSGRVSSGMGGRTTGSDTFGSSSSPGIGRGSYGSGSSSGSGSSKGSSSAGAGRGSSMGGPGIGSSAGAGPGRGSSKGGPSIGGGTKSGSAGNNSGTSRGNNPGMADKEKN
jgi:hypothetical protein